MTDSELTFAWTPSTAVLGILMVVAALALSFMIWKRNRFSASTGFLELIRVVIITGVAITLNQPEWREIFEPDEKPVLAVLYDDTGSMKTKDVVPEDGTVSAARERNEIANQLAIPEAWQSLEDRFEVELQPFGSETEGAPNGTDISGALSDAMTEYSSLRGVVLISDGDWNTGEPPSSIATRLRMQETPVFTVPVGSETKLPDLAVTAFDIPTFGIAGKPVRLPFTITSSLPRSHTATISIKTSEGEALSQSVTIPAMGRLQDTLLWTPQTVGDFSLTLTLPTSEEEHDTENNSLSAPITIRKEELKVLVIESFPRWEYRYLRNALERDPGVEVSCLLFHPGLEGKGDGPGYIQEFPEPEELSEFDVIFLGDVGIRPKQLTQSNVVSIKQQVTTQASGLVLLPGFRGNQLSLVGSEIDDLFPVILDAAQPRGWGSATPGQFELTELGARSLLTRLEDTENANAAIWSSLPGFQWYAGVTRAKAGSEILATHSSETNRYGRIPLIVTKTFGTGKILFMGTDGAWRWRKGVEDKYHYRFWGQVARWMAYQRNMASDDLMRLFYSPDRPQTGDTLTLNANAMSIGGEPLQEANVIVQITEPQGKVKSIRLQPAGEDQWGLFTGTYSPTEPGEHQLLMTCEENGGLLETTIAVQGTSLEQTGRPARYDVMEEIARITRGEMLDVPDVEMIKNAVAAVPDPEPIERRLRLWAHPVWIGVLILFLTIFWIGRKAVGAV
ncbi:MAG: hypothetical protein CMO55_21790 [Verrucomicrobiales bacterium]|nr:hypothetical protein [Verrucomicrobiales bacterium]